MMKNDENRINNSVKLSPHCGDIFSAKSVDLECKSSREGRNDVANS
jgi:hypothetical protein